MAMAFVISKHGSRDGVLKAVQAEKFPAGNQQHIEAVKAFIANEIAALPARFNGVRISCTADAHDGGRTLQLTVVPLDLHL
jgi:hypothetical protein